MLIFLYSYFFTDYNITYFDKLTGSLVLYKNFKKAVFCLVYADPVDFPGMFLQLPIIYRSGTFWVSGRFAESVLPNSISPKPFRWKDVSPNGRFAEWTFRRKIFGQSYHNTGRISVKCPSVKRIRRNVHSAKRPFGETSVRRNGFGEMEFGETDSAKRPDTMYGNIGNIEVLFNLSSFI